MTIAVIGGSGLALWPALSGAAQGSAATPYGPASAPPLRGAVNGVEVLFLPRHGPAHTLAPHRINYRANLWALRAAGAHRIVAIATVGGIRADLVPGALALPEQLIDYTWGRESSFDGPEEAADSVRHVDFTHPFDTRTSDMLAAAAEEAGSALVRGGTYAVTQGPRLETAAEIDRLERDGAHMVGMTAMPEAALARELALPYALLAVVANRAAGRGGLDIHSEIAAHLAAGIARARATVDAALSELAGR